ncbi:hypothetical protein BTVI_15594 [Pitangus sulphuratus]|nr:hypothetical protein BTVI_15594 [Pitangus sulphuratus]
MEQLILETISRHRKDEKVIRSRCCTFDEPLGSCGYSQSDDDDLNWDQVNTPIKPSSGQGMPSGFEVGNVTASISEPKSVVSQVSDSELEMDSITPL